MNDDPADERADSRRRLQLSRELEVDRQAFPHPSVGGSRGYPLWFRRLELDWFRQGLPPSVAHPWSVSRWLERVVPYRMTGNREKGELVGTDLILLGVITIVYPQASQDEMAMFIYSEGGGLYINTLISKRLKQLVVTYKKVGVEG